MTYPGSSRKRLLILLLVVSLFVCGAGVYILWSQLVRGDSSPKDMEGNAVSLQDGDLPTGADANGMKVVEDTGVRLVVPSVGLNVPVGELSEVDRQITPPTFTSAFIVRNRGAGGLGEAKTHTLFVVTHSVNHGLAPGNYLIDVSDSAAKVSIGAQISIGQLRYSITDTSTVLKQDLSTTKSVWQDSPGRLVLITCLQREQGKSLKNVIITAQLDQQE